MHYQKGDPLSAISYIEKALFCASETSQEQIQLEISSTGEVLEEDRESVTGGGRGTSGTTGGGTTGAGTTNDSEEVVEGYTAGVVVETSNKNADEEEVEEESSHGYSKTTGDDKLINGEGGDGLNLHNKKPKVYTRVCQNNIYYANNNACNSSNIYTHTQ